jgi:hypothetical protein
MAAYQLDNGTARRLSACGAAPPSPPRTSVSSDRIGTTEVSAVLDRARATFATASRDDYPSACTRCAAPLRLRHETFSDAGRWIDPVGRSMCLPPHRGRHVLAAEQPEGSDRA